MIELNKKYNFQEGEILLFNKPYEWSSFDVVKKVRTLICRELNIKKIKVGHAGTLDPLATGLLVVCTGRATKQVMELQGHDKTYKATIQLGATTPSFDLETEIDSQFPIEHINEELVEKSLQDFIGVQLQRPPVFSAKQINGERAYLKARKGETFKVAPRQVNFKKLMLLKCNLPEIQLEITCSAGTYIRSFANDFGKASNSGAHLTALERTQSGNFSLQDAMEIAEFESLMRGKKEVQFQ